MFNFPLPLPIPLHLRPQKLESLTSCLTRVAEVNIALGLLEEWSAIRGRRRVEAANQRVPLIYRVASAHAGLCRECKSVTQVGFAGRLGLSPATLEEHPQVRAWLSGVDLFAQSPRVPVRRGK